MGLKHNIAMAMAAGAIGMAGSTPAQAGPAEEWERSHADLATLQGQWTDPIYGDEYTVEGNSIILTRRGTKGERNGTPDRFVVMSNLRYDRSDGDEYHYFKGTCNQPPIPGVRGILSLERELVVTASVNTSPEGYGGFSSITSTCLKRSTRPMAQIGRSGATPTARPAASVAARPAAPVAASSDLPQSEVPPASLPVTSAQELAEIATRERLNREQAAFAARQVAENQAAKAAFDQATAERAATIARQQAEAAQREADYQAALAKWRADVEACKNGDITRCG